MEQWEWAWLAGIYEGEGSAGFNNAASVQLKILMADRDVLETVDRLFPSPNGPRPESRGPGRKTLYCWQLSDRDDVRRFLAGVMPYLHGRRTERAKAALLRLENNLGAKPKRTHCKYGHPLSGDNLYVARLTGARSCQTCRHRRDEERKERRRVSAAL